MGVLLRLLYICLQRMAFLFVGKNYVSKLEMELGRYRKQLNYFSAHYDLINLSDAL